MHETCNKIGFQNSQPANAKNLQLKLEGFFDEEEGTKIIGLPP
jgi:hypothetical protein